MGNIFIYLLKIYFRESVCPRARRRGEGEEKENLKQAPHKAWSPAWAGSHNMRS